MNITKFEQMYKMLSGYNCEMSKNVSTNLKCGRCKNILINACQIPCGCRYCLNCVKEMLENGVKCCPGNTYDCKDENLSHNHLDYRANKEISKLVMKCPKEMCLHKCELIDMEEHLRICGKQSMKCPFSDLGCNDMQMSTEMINEHFQMTNFNHNMIIVQIIDNIRKEIDELKKKEEKNKNKIEKLMENLKVKDEIIDSINEEVKFIKLEKEKLWLEFKSFKENLGDKIEEISAEMKTGNLQSIESINNETNWMKMENAKLVQKVNSSKLEMENKIEEIDNKIERQTESLKMKDEHKRVCEILKENLERKTEEILAEIEKEKLARIESINEETRSMKSRMNETNKKSEMRMETKINELCKIIKISKYPLMEWTIDKLDERRNRGECISSDYFTDMIKPYKLQLTFYATGWRDAHGKGCSIYLRIYSSTLDEFLPWPFKADVTMKIVNKTNPNANRSITKPCQMNKPTSCNSSSRFDYSYSDLTKAGVILENCFIVECFVNFK